MKKIIMTTYVFTMLFTLATSVYANDNILLDRCFYCTEIHTGYMFSGEEIDSKLEAFMVIKDPFGREGFTIFDFNDLLKISLTEYLEIAEHLMGELSDNDIDGYTEEYEKQETMFFMYNGAQHKKLEKFIIQFQYEFNSDSEVNITKLYFGEEYQFDNVVYEDNKLISEKGWIYTELMNVRRATPKEVFHFVLMAY